MSSSSDDDHDGLCTKEDRRGSRHSGSEKLKECNEGSSASCFPPAPSDIEALRSHYRFVIPENSNDAQCDNGGRQNSGSQYGATWQERMVQSYHSCLFKEYVLVDVRQALSKGRVGMRWRTSDEVKSGKGFASCGNLHCVGKSGGNASDVESGIIHPSRNTTLAAYLESCARDNRRCLRKKSRDEKVTDEENLERREIRRLSRLRHGIGLHDYEVNFAYIEGGVQKQELVKARMCLRCAPSLFVSSDEVRGAVAIKARAAREKSVRTHTDLTTDATHGTQRTELLGTDKPATENRGVGSRRGGGEESDYSNSSASRSPPRKKASKRRHRDHRPDYRNQKKSK